MQVLHSIKRTIFRCSNGSSGRPLIAPFGISWNALTAEMEGRRVPCCESCLPLGHMRCPQSQDGQSCDQQLVLGDYSATKASHGWCCHIERHYTSCFVIVLVLVFPWCVHKFCTSLLLRSVSVLLALCIFATFPSSMVPQSLSSTAFNRFSNNDHQTPLPLDVNQFLFLSIFFQYEYNFICIIYMLSFVELLSGLCLYISPYIFFHKAFTSHAATCCTSNAHNIINVRIQMCHVQTKC